MNLSLRDVGAEQRAEADEAPESAAATGANIPHI
jgi:hypothetical protein